MSEEEVNSGAFGFAEVVVVDAPCGDIVWDVVDEVVGAVVEGRVVPGWVGRGAGFGEGGAGRVVAPSGGGGSGLCRLGGGLGGAAPA